MNITFDIYDQNELIETVELYKWIDSPDQFNETEQLENYILMTSSSYAHGIKNANFDRIMVAYQMGWLSIGNVHFHAEKD